MKSPQLHRVSRPLGSQEEGSSSGHTTELGEDEGAQLCSMHGQLWETMEVDEMGVTSWGVGEETAAGTGGEPPQGGLYPRQGESSGCAKRRKVAVKPGSVGAWVRKVGGAEVAAHLTGHQG